MLRIKAKLLHLEEKTAVRDSRVLAWLCCEIPSRKHLKSSHYRGYMDPVTKFGFQIKEKNRCEGTGWKQSGRHD